ncbi:hypothetical protein BMS3Abin15_00538 [bacterium BMS3Abin15]|nr:hypothetical protein BMS3Abin15_00538 [bacterium BMS3Abin15]HDH07782.1 hypothetical protein [Candidatus Moranbacteria bacterium]HDZ85363.1 hypothetical protein [Candidatus Moranbacteria bacterium]
MDCTTVGYMAMLSTFILLWIGIHFAARCFKWKIRYKSASAKVLIDRELDLDSNVIAGIIQHANNLAEAEEKNVAVEVTKAYYCMRSPGAVIKCEIGNRVVKSKSAYPHRSIYDVDREFSKWYEFVRQDILVAFT